MDSYESLKHGRILQRICDNVLGCLWFCNSSDSYCDSWDLISRNQINVSNTLGIEFFSPWQLACLAQGGPDCYYERIW